MIDGLDALLQLDRRLVLEVVVQDAKDSFPLEKCDWIVESTTWIG